jgi:SpoIVB peptidase S55
MLPMRPRSLPAALLALLAATAPAHAADDIMPLSAVRPGLEGVGRTVFEGARVDEFGVRILGVLENALGPKQSLILARLQGGPLEKTGVIAGMSGSPVFIDGKMVGAIAYAFPFGKEPIAGITPIGEMLEAGRNTAPRAASARFHLSSAARSPAAPLDRAAVAAALRRPLPSVEARGLLGEPLPADLAGATLRPLALPLSFSGFDPETFEWARGLFSSLGFAPVMGGGSASADSLGPVPDLAPGAAVGVSLIEGDLDLSVTGTITRIDDGRVYAFGHPFYNLGPTQFPLKKAWVYSVFPSLQVSWKIAAALDAVGTMDQDRTTAVSGRLGASPRMIPVEIRIRSPRAGERSFRFRVVEDELFTPVLAYVSLLSVLQGQERSFGASTLAVDARLALSGGRTVRVEDVFATDQPAQQAAAVLAGPLALLEGNDFEKVGIERLDVQVDAWETLRRASIERAWVTGPQPLRPGTATTVRVQLRTYRGDTLTETLPLALPRSVPGGTCTLLVSDAATMDATEQREMRQPFVPRDIGQLLRALNTLRSGNRLYARLTCPEPGAIVGGEYLPALPGSVLSVLGSPDQGTSVVPLPSTVVWSAEQSLDQAVSGSRQTSVAVER